MLPITEDVQQFVLVLLLIKLASRGDNCDMHSTSLIAIRGLTNVRSFAVKIKQFYVLFVFILSMALNY